MIMISSLLVLETFTSLRLLSSVGSQMSPQDPLISVRGQKILYLKLGQGCHFGSNEAIYIFNFIFLQLVFIYLLIYCFIYLFIYLLYFLIDSYRPSYIKYWLRCYIFCVLKISCQLFQNITQFQSIKLRKEKQQIKKDYDTIFR